MTAVCSQLQPNRQRAIDLLLAGQSCREVAEELGVSRVTVWRWTQDPGVVDQRRTVRGDRRQAIRESVDAAALEAVGVLHGLMRDARVPPAVRARAACGLLDRADLGDELGEDREIRIVSAVSLDDLTDEQIEARRACPDGLKGLRPMFHEEVEPPPRLVDMG